MHFTEALAHRYLEGFKLPPGVKLEELSEDLLDPMPEKPKMHHLVYAGPDKAQLFIPVELVKTWQSNMIFRDRFCAWLDNFTKKYAIADEKVVAASVEPTANTPGKKRKFAESDIDDTPMKCKKLDSTVLVDSKVITNPCF